MEKRIVIADLDGAIALIDHRRHWLDKEKHPKLTSDERWRRFFAEPHKDPPNIPVICESRVRRYLSHSAFPVG